MDGSSHTHGARRTHHSTVEVPKQKTEHAQKKMAMYIGVGATMLVILSLYVASFRQNVLFREARENAPRWSTIENGIIQGSAPYESQLNGLATVKDAVVSMVKAKALQTKSIDIMKTRIESASGTAALNN